MNAYSSLYSYVKFGIELPAQFVPTTYDDDNDGVNEDPQGEWVVVQKRGRKRKNEEVEEEVVVPTDSEDLEADGSTEMVLEDKKHKKVAKPPRAKIQRLSKRGSGLRDDGRKGLQRINRVSVRGAVSKRAKRVGRMQGKGAVLGGKRSGWH